MAIDPAEQLAAIGQAVITTDVGGTVVYWNRAAEELYGWSAEEALGRNISELCVPDLSRETAQDIMTALREGVPWSGGFATRRRDGSVFPALVTDAGVYRDGVLVGIIGVSTNLGSALRPLLERSTDAALVLRSDAVVTYASPAVEQMFGWKQVDLVGHSFVPLVHRDDRHQLARLLEAVVARPGIHPPVEVRIPTGESWRWAEAAFTNLLDDPHVRGVVCNLRASVARQAQQEAEHRIAQLEAALQSRLSIELAKGYLVARAGTTADAAFQLIRDHARRNQLTVQEVARRVVEDGLDVSDTR